MNRDVETSELRVFRTMVHRKFGIFRYSEELRSLGVIAPADQIRSVGLFIERGLGRAREFPRISDDNELESWMRDSISTTLDVEDIGDRPESLHWILLRTGGIVAWNPFREFAELLNYRCGATAYAQARSRLSGKGINVHLLDTWGMAEQFVNKQLPRATRSFDLVRGRGREEQWLASVFYRFALNEVFSDRSNRANLEELTSAFTITPEQRLEQEQQIRALVELPGALAQLPRPTRSAIELYFGFDGPERTVAEVANRIGISEYVARSTLIQGLAQLAARLNVDGVFTRQEFSLLQLTFGQGRDITQAARELNIDVKAARQLAIQITTRFHNALRPRTVARSIVSKGSKEENMTGRLTAPALEDRLIPDVLRGLKKTPRIRNRESSNLFEANLGGRWTLVTRVRDVIANDQDLLTELTDSNVPLEWVAVPDPTVERADRLDDEEEWNEALARIRQRSWIVAETLLVLCRDSDEGRALFEQEEESRITERIHRTLSGLSVEIESAMPASIRKQPRVRFLIEVRGALDVSGTWETDDAADGIALDLRALILESAATFGELSYSHGSVLVDVLVKHLAEGGTVTLPGFSVADESSSEVIYLLWIPPTLTVESEPRPQLLESA